MSPRFDPEAYKKEIGLTEDAAAADIQSNEETKQEERLSDSLTPRQAAAQSKKEEQKDGITTKIGEALGYVTNAEGLTQDTINLAAAGLNAMSGGRLQGLDDAILGSEEYKEARIKAAEAQARRSKEGKMDALEQTLYSTNNALEGASEGVEAGIAMPFTVAARLEGADAPWSDPPEVLKDSPVGESVFKAVEIITPTLLTGGVAGGYGLGAAATGGLALAGESALETATQRSADDLLAGRELAIQLGNLADAGGYDGAQLTKDLIEGRKPHAQAMVAVVGFGQNLGINWTSNKLLGEIQKRLFPGKPGIFEVPEGTELFHGTSEKAAGLIQKDGFKTGPGIAGRGVYLAEDDYYASLYAMDAELNQMPEEAFEALMKSDEDGPAGLLVAGYLPGGVKILDIPGSGLSTRIFARRLGNKKRGEVIKFIRTWAKKNGFDGIRFHADSSNWNAKPGTDEAGMIETVIFDPKVADRITSNATPTGLAPLFDFRKLETQEVKESFITVQQNPSNLLRVVSSLVEAIFMAMASTQLMMRLLPQAIERRTNQKAKPIKVWSIS